MFAPDILSCIASSVSLRCFGTADCSIDAVGNAARLGAACPDFAAANCVVSEHSATKDIQRPGCKSASLNFLVGSALMKEQLGPPSGSSECC